MWEEIDSSTEVVSVYVRLLEEGIEVSRPTEALNLGNGIYEIRPTPDYSPENETWEFIPGSKVGLEKRARGMGTYMVAVELQDVRT